MIRTHCDDSALAFAAAIDIQAVRIVSAIADAGSITAAAKTLGFSQPAISQQLQRAEARIGATLVNREGRVLTLTAEGRVLSLLAPRLDEVLLEAGRELAGLTNARSGVITLAGFPSASSTLLPAFLNLLRGHAPRVRPSYIEAEPPEAIAMVIAGTVDVAITCVYPTLGESSPLARSGLVGLPLFTDELFVALPAAHPLAKEPTISIADLESDDWVAGCHSCRAHMVHACATAGFQPRITFETDNHVAVLGLVSSGLGLAVLPGLSISTAATPDDVVIRPTEPRTVRHIFAVTDRENASTEHVRAVMGLLRTIDGAQWGLRRMSTSMPVASTPEETSISG
ncbi:LysR family transcriptional regulator [Microbacterium sp. A84]|uniref:LysR family transcriptional regulator n=1 Tax=Microbacterium sp. A84 TaxID=3450715 RepID=UPI003F43360E